MLQLSEVYGGNEVSANPPVSRGMFKLAIGAIYLMAFAMLASVGTQWMATQSLVEKTGRLAVEQRQFNESLILSIGQLSERVGWMTSSDLAPVRFRFRCPDGVSIPSGEMLAVLTRVTPETNTRSTVHSLNSRNGVMDFGLIGPGRFELSLESSDGLTAVHEFQHLPGVPLDRCVICPHAVDTSLTDARATVVLDSECSLDGGIVLLKVAPAEFTHEGWTWTPPSSWPEMYIAASTNGERLPLETAERWPQLVTAAADKATIFLESGSDLLTIPYRYCEVREMICFQPTLTNDGEETLSQLGTIVFKSRPNQPSSREEHVSLNNTDGPVRWVSSAKPPRFETRLIDVTKVIINCPDGCVQEMLRVAQSDVPPGNRTLGRRRTVSDL